MKVRVLLIMFATFCCSSCNKHIWEGRWHGYYHPPFPANVITEYPWTYFPKKINDTSENGEKTGLWIVIDEANQIVSLTNYESDSSQTKQVIYKNNNLYNRKEWSGKRVRFKCYSNGKRMTFPEKINQLSQDGKKTGMWIEHKDSVVFGRNISIKHFKGDSLHGSFVEYWGNGNIRKKGNYAKGKCCGWWESYAFPRGRAGVRLYNRRGKPRWGMKGEPVF